MTDFNNLTPTGRKTSGPTADLIELAVPDGNIQTAIVYNDAYHGHTGLTTDVELVQSFMEFPMVDGLSDMTRAVIGKGIFQFDTGSVMVLYDILRAMRDKRKPLGIRAGIELCLHIGNALQEASENGPMQGIYSSNGLTPWRIVVDAEGLPSIIGYGLPQIDMVTFRESGEGSPREESFKCCPPERLLSGDEDISSDVYSLALIAVEVMTGKPLLKGTAKQLYKLVTHGEAQQILLSNPGKIPSDVHNTLVQALAYDPMGRFEEPRDFVASMEEALEQSKVTGDSLAEIIKKVAPTLKKGKVLQSASDTPARKPIPIRMAAGGGRRAKPAVRDAAPTAHTPDAGDRWGKVARSGGTEVTEAPSRRRSRSESTEEANTSSRRTRSARNRTDETGTRRSRRSRSDTNESDENATEAPTRTRRSRGDTPTARRSRRTRSAEAVEDVQIAEDAETNVAQDEAVQAESETKESSTAPKRPRRAKRASKKDEGTVDAAVETKVETPEEQKDATAPAETPKAPRRAKRAAKTEAVDAEASEETKTEASPEEPKTETPKRPRRAKRASTKTKDTEATPAETQAAESPEDAPKKPRRAKRATKKEETKEAAAEQTKQEAASEEPKAEPAKRPRRAKRASTKEETKTVAAEDTDDASPKRARRATRASSADESPRRTRRSRTSEDATETPRRARRTRSDTSDGEDAPKRARRRQRTSDDEETPSRPRRSRRSRTSDE